MKQIFGKIMAATLSLITFIACYDDTLLWNELEEHDKKLKELYEKVNILNSNVRSLQTTVEALNERDYVTNITKTDDYVTMVFSNHGTVRLELTPDTPNIAIKQDIDGKYYWTLDGEWILDKKGNKMPSIGETGKDGENGVTPQFRIQEDKWEVSYDGGDLWTTLGDARGETGATGDSFFQDVIIDEDNVILILSDGTALMIPRTAQTIGISFDDFDVGICEGGTKIVNFMLSNATKTTLVKAIAQNGWKVKVAMSSNTSGTITVTAPSPMVEDEIIVFVYDGDKTTIMTTINFVTGVITPSMPSVAINGRSGVYSLPISTNLDIEIFVPLSAREWLSVNEISTKAMTNREYSLVVTDNHTDQVRNAIISLKDKNSDYVQNLTITQAVNDYLDFEDQNFQKALLKTVDQNNDGEINKNEPETVECLDVSSSNIVSLAGLEHFSSLKTLDCSGNMLTSLDISSLRKLNTLDCSGNEIEHLDITNCSYTFFELHAKGVKNITLLDGQNAINYSTSGNKYPHFTFIADNSESTNYSRHETIVQLQQHEVGVGIPLVFMGDAFLDVDIESGVYDYRMKEAVEYLFSEEPYKTYRNRFDVYYIELVSQSRKLDGKSTALGCNGTFTEIITPEEVQVLKNVDNTTKIISFNQPCFKCVVLNRIGLDVRDFAAPGYRTAYFSANSDIRCSQTINQKQLRHTLLHEFGGHAIGFLQDEYVEFNESYPSTTVTGSNISLTNDPDVIPWKEFLNLPQYSGHVGIYEGGGRYAYSVWRSSETSIMEGDLDSHFNAVSRHIIYKLIMNLSQEEYSWEGFLQYDKKNL